MENQDYKKELVKLIREAAYNRSTWQVWEDFVYMAAATLSNSCNYMQSREDEYLQRIAHYDKPMQMLFAQMMATLFDAFEAAQFADILGEVYMELELYNKWKGQFFTPYSMSLLMARLNFEDPQAEIADKGFISLYDPTCGGGALLIAAAQHQHESGINYQRDALFVAQDIDRTTALMCYVQMAVLGMPGYVIIGDTLLGELESYDRWYTPFYFIAGLPMRRRRKFEKATQLGLKFMTKEPELITSTPELITKEVDLVTEIPKQSTNLDEFTQLKMF